jgi:hypothetical protein
MRRFAAAVAIATCVVLFAAQPARATYRGKNGLIAIAATAGMDRRSTRSSLTERS